MRQTRHVCGNFKSAMSTNNLPNDFVVVEHHSVGNCNIDERVERRCGASEVGRDDGDEHTSSGSYNLRMDTRDGVIRSHQARIYDEATSTQRSLRMIFVLFYLVYYEVYGRRQTQTLMGDG
uniref:Uncharacterized protein n=1 Tax=Ascaris lumbricoides TaxID=6252 RepID=A0A0M3HUQ0_ASCLU